jgi:hypothetical protein
MRNIVTRWVGDIPTVGLYGLPAILGCGIVERMLLNWLDAPEARGAASLLLLALGPLVWKRVRNRRFEPLAAGS